MVIDEAYHYFYAPTFMPLIKKYDNLLILRTFSKLFSIAGLRIGYVSGKAELIEYIEKEESTFNVNNIAILFSQGVIRNRQPISRLIDTEHAGRIWIVEKLKGAGYQTIVMEGNYVLFLPKKDPKIIVEKLKKEKIWVRDYSNGIPKGWIRVSTCSITCMKKFWDTFNQISLQDGRRESCCICCTHFIL